jgi:serine/threonine protein kinase
MVRLGWKAARSRAFRDSDDFMDEFIATLSELGGIYAKFLQGILLGYMVSKGKKMSAGQLDIFEDNPNPGLSIEQINAVLGPATSRIQLKTLDPIGVGSYSAVYSATLDGVKPVVVKILRPDIHSEINTDLKFLRKLTYIFRIANIKIVAVDISQFYSSFKAACLKETDFPAEYEFAYEMYERYKNHDYIVVPKTYVELCNDSLIIQEQVGGISAKTLVEAKMKDHEDINVLTEKYYDTNLVFVMRELSYEMFYSFLTNRSFHGDLHPGNVRILPNNKVAILDFGIKAEPYKANIVPAVINKLLSDAKFLEGDFDLVRLLDAHFRLYMAKLYESIESLLAYHKRDVREFFSLLVRSINADTDNVSEAKRKQWINSGPAAMLNDLLKGSDKFGIEVKVRDHTTQRGVSTQYSLLKALGVKGSDGLGPVYIRLGEAIMNERPELFDSKKLLLPDLALENVYGWLEKLTSTNPELATKLRKALNDKVSEDSPLAPAST